MSISHNKENFEVCIIGGGIIGTALFSELCRAGVDCVLVEASDDIANGSTKANSGIIHAGYDPQSNSLMAKYNVQGNAMYPDMCKRLGVEYNNCGTLVVGTNDDTDKLKELLKRGIQNGVPNLRIVKGEELRQMEPNLADRITQALYAPTGAIVSPYLVCIALAEEGVVNGGNIKFNFKVDKIKKSKDLFNIYADDQKVTAKYLINCAGAGAEQINQLLGVSNPPCNYVKGVYMLLDKTQTGFVKRPIFPLPSKVGKGILAIPTIHGNIMFGPTATECNANDTAVDIDSINYIKEQIPLNVKNANFRKVIKLFAGVRNKCGKDFVIEKSANIPHYFYTLGIQSPGLSSAPAIALKIKQDLMNDGLKTKNKKTISRTPYINIQELPQSKANALIKQNPDYGKIVCRCENISLGEIKDILHSPLKPKSVDAIKRRLRPTMGKCQGGFCTPKLIKIISEECKIPMEQVTLNGIGSEFIKCDLKEFGKFEKIQKPNNRRK